ncbi:MAG: hypothetical protein ACYTFY_11615 [Planctomycetota bacterium]|jgi:hypothetical protein
MKIFKPIFLIFFFCSALNAAEGTKKPAGTPAVTAPALKLNDFQRKNVVGEWSEWQISLKEKDKNTSGAAIRLRYTLTSIKSDIFYYTVQTKINNKIDSRENIELNLPVFWQDIAGTKNNHRDIESTAGKKVKVQLIDRMITGIKERVTLQKEGMVSYVDRIISSDFKNLPVFISTDKVDIIMVAFGTGSEPPFPIKVKKEPVPAAKPAG